MCPNPPSGSHGSPASRDRRAVCSSPWGGDRLRRRRYVTQLAEQVDPSVFRRGSRRRAAHKWIGAPRGKGSASHRSVAAHTGAEVRRLERHSRRRTARWCCCGKTRWIRSGQTGRPNRSAPSRSSRILFRCSCRGEIARIAGTRREDRSAVSSPIPRGRVDLQHPRQRRPAHAPSSGARDHRGERTCRAFPRKRKTGIEAGPISPGSARRSSRWSFRRGSRRSPPPVPASSSIPT